MYVHKHYVCYSPHSPQRTLYTHRGASEDAVLTLRAYIDIVIKYVRHEATMPFYFNPHVTAV
jgi:hypothetical protein